MSKCPYCNAEISLEAFFDVIEKEKKGIVKKKSEILKGKDFMLELVLTR